MRLLNASYKQKMFVGPKDSGVQLCAVKFRIKLVLARDYHSNFSLNKTILRFISLKIGKRNRDCCAFSNCVGCVRRDFVPGPSIRISPSSIASVSYDKPTMA